MSVSLREAVQKLDPLDDGLEILLVITITTIVFAEGLYLHARNTDNNDDHVGSEFLQNSRQSYVIGAMYLCLQIVIYSVIRSLANNRTQDEWIHFGGTFGLAAGLGVLGAMHITDNYSTAFRVVNCCIVMVAFIARWVQWKNKFEDSVLLSGSPLPEQQLYYPALFVLFAVLVGVGSFYLYGNDYDENHYEVQCVLHWSVAIVLAVDFAKMWFLAKGEKTHTIFVHIVLLLLGIEAFFVFYTLFISLPGFGFFNNAIDKAGYDRVGILRYYREFEWDPIIGPVSDFSQESEEGDDTTGEGGGGEGGEGDGTTDENKNKKFPSPQDHPKKQHHRTVNRAWLVFHACTLLLTGILFLLNANLRAFSEYRFFKTQHDYLRLFYIMPPSIKESDAPSFKNFIFPIVMAILCLVCGSLSAFRVTKTNQGGEKGYGGEGLYAAAITVFFVAFLVYAVYFLRVYLSIRKGKNVPTYPWMENLNSVWEHNVEYNRLYRDKLDKHKSEHKATHKGSLTDHVAELYSAFALGDPSLLARDS